MISAKKAKLKSEKDNYFLDKIMNYIDYLYVTFDLNKDIKEKCKENKTSIIYPFNNEVYPKIKKNLLFKGYRLTQIEESIYRVMVKIEW